MNGLNDFEESKLFYVLDYFLSLHESLIVYDAIFDEKIDTEELHKILQSFITNK